MRVFNAAAEDTIGECVHYTDAKRTYYMVRCLLKFFDKRRIIGGINANAVEF